MLEQSHLILKAVDPVYRFVIAVIFRVDFPREDCKALANLVLSCISPALLILVKQPA